MLPRIYLKKGKERSASNFHPWIFSGAIQKEDKNLQDGDIVEVYAADETYLGTGHFNKGSITVRLFTFTKQTIDDDFWIKKLQAAYDLRAQLRLTNSSETNVYRLVHGEGDGLPGLIIDVYDDVAVIQCHTIGMYWQRDSILNALEDIYGDKLVAVYDKSAETLHKQTGQETGNSFLKGNKTSGVVKENNLLFEVDWIAGQKTGFFIDQRYNRELLSQYSNQKKVLNTFAYTGGFSLYALNAGANMVHSVDSSKRAKEMALKNVDLNFKNANHEFFDVDVFDYLKTATEDYDVMVLDPPAFAKHLDAVKRASIGYRNLNYEAFKRINKNGIVFTFSCSQAIDKILFRKIVFAAAAMSKRNVRVLHQLTQPADHPISIYHPEGEYLKGLVLHVE